MEEVLSLGFFRETAQKNAQGLNGCPWKLVPAPHVSTWVTDKLHHPLHSVGNFPTPHQEKNKEKTTNTGGNDSRVLLTAVGGDSSAACDPAPNQPKGGGEWGRTSDDMGCPD